MNQNIFKAYDIRGKYPEEINESVVAEIVSLFVSSFKIQDKRYKIIIGHDVRLSSLSLYQVIISNLSMFQSCNLSIMSVGMISTPMLSFLVNYFRADFGIMITASHNPKEYNGLKIVGKNAEPISGYELLKYIR